jgi:hypothetical protein
LVGDAVTFAPVVVFSPAEGLHEYIVAPLTDKLVDEPEQIVVLLEPVNAGTAFTVIDLVAVLLHPFEVPVIV